MRLLNVLTITAGLHLALALVCVLALFVAADPISGAHPALKPLKFALSIAILLGSVALVLRALDAPTAARTAIAWTLSLTMIVETVAIVMQAARGRASHFNTSTALDAALWHTMAGAITVALLSLIALALLASVRPLAFHPLVAMAVRIGLWLLLLVAVSGFAMGGRGSHAVGSGDLRIPHFFALHALQALPVLALVLLALPLGDRARWSLLIVGIVGWTALAVGTLVHAFAGGSRAAANERLLLGHVATGHAGHHPSHHADATEPG